MNNAALITISTRFEQANPIYPIAP